MTLLRFRRFCNPRLEVTIRVVSTDSSPLPLEKPSIFLGSLHDKRRPTSTNIFLKRKRDTRARVIVTVNRWILFVQDNRARLTQRNSWRGYRSRRITGRHWPFSPLQLHVERRERERRALASGGPFPNAVAFKKRIASCN